VLIPKLLGYIFNKLHCGRDHFPVGMGEGLLVVQVVSRPQLSVSSTGCIYPQPEDVSPLPRAAVFLEGLLLYDEGT
jgi:hypothetical protein